jgi:hypothetical protein
MRDRRDLDRIQEPAEPQSDQPDQKTEAEATEYQTKKKTPTEQLGDSHQAHLATMRDRIDYHCQEKTILQSHITTLQQGLDGERLQSTNHCIRCAKLESLAFSVGCTSLLGSILTVAGGGAVSVAGAWPNLSDAHKGWLSAAGSATAFCGLMVMSAAFVIGWYGKPSSQE